MWRVLTVNKNQTYTHSIRKDTVKLHLINRIYQTSKTMTKKKSKSRRNNFVYKSEQPSSELIGHVGGLVSPFAEESRSKKIHDANAAKTFTFKSVSTLQIPVNSDGSGYAQFNPTIKSALRCLKGETAMDAGTGGITDQIASSPSFYDNNVTNYTDLTSTGARYRLVSWGIRLISLENALDAKGQMLIRELDLNAVAGTRTQTFSDNYKTVPITHNMDYTIIPNHIGEAYQTFIPMTTTYTSLLVDPALEPGYKSIHVTFSGMTPGSGVVSTGGRVINAEVVMNLEILPQISTIGMRLATPPAPHSHAILSAVHNTRAALPLVHKTTSLWGKVKSVASNVLKSGANFLLNRYGGPVGSALTGMLANTGDNVVRRLTSRPMALISN